MSITLRQLNSEEKKEISNWVAKTLFGIVMRRGGYPGLCCSQYDREPTHNFNSFQEYESWTLKQILKYKELFNQYITHEMHLSIEFYDADLVSEEIDLMDALFPFMDSDKDMDPDYKCETVSNLNCILVEITENQLSEIRNNLLQNQ